MSRGAGPFKVCGSCKETWGTWEVFVRDPAVRLLGLQSLFTHPEANLLVFEHSCGSSISILAHRIRHILHESEPDSAAVLLMGTDQCRGHCLRMADLEACDAPCVNAFDRRLILLVRRMKEQDCAAPGPLG